MSGQPRDSRRSHAAPEHQRGERQETFMVARIAEVVIPDDAPDPQGNRAARRAAARAQKPSDGRTALRQGPTGPQEAREAACTPLSPPNSPPRSGSRTDPQNASDSRPVPPLTRTETR